MSLSSDNIFDTLLKDLTIMGFQLKEIKTPQELWIQGMFSMAKISHRVAKEMWEPGNEVRMSSIYLLHNKNTSFYSYLRKN